VTDSLAASEASIRLAIEVARGPVAKQSRGNCDVPVAGTAMRCWPACIPASKGRRAAVPANQRGLKCRRDTPKPGGITGESSGAAHFLAMEIPMNKRHETQWRIVAAFVGSAVTALLLASL